MRHRNKTLKLGRKSQHRHLMLANLVCSLIERGRVQTTLQKAKAARSLAEKMVTLAKGGTLHNRRTAISRLRQEIAVKKLFTEIGPRSASRQGGYTRIVKIGQRIGDAGHIAFLEWVDQAAPVATPEAPTDAKAKTVDVAPAEPKKKASKASK